MYIHERDEWPNFHWDEKSIASQLGAVRHRQGRLLGRMEALGVSLRDEAVLDTLTQDVLKSSEIEGEVLERDEVRSSLARRLGVDIGALTPADRHVEGIVEMMLDATQRYDAPLSTDRLFGWHAALFPTGRSGMQTIRVGDWREARSDPMHVVSGPMGRDHPRIRLPESKIESQVLAIFDKMKVESEEVRDWFRLVLASQTKDSQADSLAQRAELQRQETLLVQQQDRLLNMRLNDEIDQETFAAKHTELRDRLANIKLQLDVVDRSHDETAELASKVFELSQTLTSQWLTADYTTKRRLLEIVFLNCTLDDVTLVPTIRKPFDVLAKGLISEKSRGDKIRTCDLYVPNVAL